MTQAWDRAEPMQDACHKRTQFNDLALHEFSQLSGQSARPVVGRSWVRILSRTRIFSLSHGRVMLINLPFTFHSPSLFYLSLPTMTSTLQILVVCGTLVTYELCLMTLLSMSSCTTRGFWDVIGSNPIGIFFLCPMLMSC